MNKPSTSMEMQRATFVESLHNSLKKQASKAIAEHNKFITLASSYVDDGLEESEAIELLMIDGLSREASESYISMALSKEGSIQDDLQEYSFQFEDAEGRVYSSFDVGKTIRAASEEDAWSKALECLDDQSGIEPEKILSVNRL